MCKANENSRALAKAFKDLGPVPRHCISPSFSLAYHLYMEGAGNWRMFTCKNVMVILNTVWVVSIASVQKFL